MSGGSYNYAYHHLCEFCRELEWNLRERPDERRQAFLALARRVSMAMHAIEWVDSDDFSPGGDHQAIEECFNYAKTVVLP